MDALKSMNQPNSSSKRKKTIRNDSFLEAFKSIGGSIGDSFKDDLAKGTMQSAVNQLFNRKQNPTSMSGDLSPDEKIDVEKIIQREKSQTKEVVRGFYERTRRQETLVFSKREEEVKIQIKALRGDIQKLIQVSKEVAQETEKVAFEEIVSPGTYHINFFEKIRSLLSLARIRIEESRSWLSLWQSRSKKRSHYWAQVKNSGTKFMLSQERYMSTQMG